jgi:hypothetical protein
MPRFRSSLSIGIATSFLLLGVIPAATLPADLAKYRTFRLGTSLSTVRNQAGSNLSEIKIIHRRPVLIQELEWRPGVLGSSVQTDPAKELLFRFYEGELFLIVVTYDRYETEGLTADDLIEAISMIYGPAEKPAGVAKTTQGRFGDSEEIVAEWQDLQYRFELIRSSYGPSFKLVGVLKRLETLADAAILKAKRLDEQEAPQRDAVRRAAEEEAARATLEKARLVNKPKFRP